MENERDRRRAVVNPLDEGFQLGARIAYDEAVGTLADAMLRLLGKDRSDGYIDLGAAGRWYPGTDGGRAQKVEDGDVQ